MTILLSENTIVYKIFQYTYCSCPNRFNVVLKDFMSAASTPSAAWPFCLCVEIANGKSS